MRTAIIFVIVLIVIFVFAIEAAEEKGAPKREKTDKSAEKFLQERVKGVKARTDNINRIFDQTKNKENENNETKEKARRPPPVDKPLHKDQVERGIQNPKKEPNIREENRKPQPEFQETVKAEFKKILERSPIVIFSRKSCDLCDSAAVLVENFQIPVEIVKIDQLEDFSEWKQYLRTETRQKTFPYIYINGKFQGGFASLQNLILTTDSILYQLSPIANELLQKSEILDQINENSASVQM